MFKFKFLILPFLTILFWSCEHVHKSISEGNSAYFDGHFSKAIDHYNKALELDSSSYVASFNKGNALYKKQVGVDTLEQHWKRLIQGAHSETDIANIYHNLGNSFLAYRKIKEAIEAYKSALRLRPNFEDTRYNLAYAQKLLPPEDKNKDKDKNQDKDNQDKNKDDKDKQDQDSKNKKDNQNKDQGDNKSEDQEKKENGDDQKEGAKGQNDEQKKSGQKKPQQGQLTKEQAKRLLDHIRRQENGIRAKVNKGKEKNASTENKSKNW